MPGRTQQEALDAFKDPIQQAVSCLGQAKVLLSTPAQDETAARALTLNHSGYMSLRQVNRPNPRVIDFHMTINFHLAKQPELENWKVQTDAYRYRLVVDASESLLFHWHPEGRSSFDRPHLHVGNRELAKHALLSGKAHVPTARVSLEEVVNFLIQDLGVPPATKDWESRLLSSAEIFRRYRSWH